MVKYIKYSVLLRRNCLVGGLCYEILEVLVLWFPIDGNCVIIVFLWAGDIHILNGFCRIFCKNCLCIDYVFCVVNWFMYEIVLVCLADP